MSRRSLAVLASLSALSLAVGLTGCGGDPLAGDGGDDTETIVIGSQGFPESDVLAHLYGEALKAAGYAVEYKLGIGSRETFIPGLQDGSIDLIPDYAGNLLYGADPEATATSTAEVMAALPAALDPLGLTISSASMAEDADALVVTRAFADEHELISIADLAPIAAEITLGANTEFESRPYGRAGLESVYGVTGWTFKAIDDYGGPGTLKDLLDGVIQVADIYTTTPSIGQNDLVVLEDPKNLIAAQNIVPLMRADIYTIELANVLNNVSRMLTTAELMGLNEVSAGDSKPSPEKVATDWLKEKGLI